MSDQDAHHLDRPVRPGPRPASSSPQAPVDPEWYAREDLRRALAAHDISVVYRALVEAGVSQRRIAQLTGQSQSEVCEILKGRTVISYAVLERIADGLGIPRTYLGLSYGEDAYAGGVPSTTPEELLAMLRRHVLAYGGVAITGAAVAKVGEALAALPGPPPVPLPTRLSPVHVVQVQDLTRRLGEAGTGSVSAPEVLSAAAGWATGLLDVAGEDRVRRALTVAVAELHIEAGWSAFSDLLYPRAMYHYGQALELATDVGDAYLQATALALAGLASAEHGELDDGLKMAQCAQVAAWKIPKDDDRAVVVSVPGRAAVEAATLADGASVLSQLGDHDTAARWLAQGRELWTPSRTDPFGDLDRPGAELALRRGRLDVADQLAAASVRRWDGISPIGRAASGIVLATVHVRAGGSDGLVLAHDAITSVSRLSSARPRARKRLEPLADALEAHPSGDARDLARHARTLAA